MHNLCFYTIDQLEKTSKLRKEKNKGAKMPVLPQEKLIL
jgi:hypothetical protein